MRKLVAIAAALGFLGTTSLTPVQAAPAGDLGFKSEDFSAQKKKAKKAAKKSKKKAKKKDVSSVQTSEDLSAQKKKAKKAKKAKKPAKKQSNLIVYRIAA